MYVFFSQCLTDFSPDDESSMYWSGNRFTSRLPCHYQNPAFHNNFYQPDMEQTTYSTGEVNDYELPEIELECQKFDNVDGGDSGDSHVFVLPSTSGVQTQKIIQLPGMK